MTAFSDSMLLVGGPNAQLLAQRATTALANNVAYLGAASHTQAEVVQQVSDLTRQMDGLLRFLLSDYTAAT